MGMFWVYGCMDVWVYGSEGVKVCRCIVYKHGCGVWVHECMRVRVLGYGWENR